MSQAPQVYAIDAAFRANPQPAEGSMNATAWGEWASSYAQGSWQHLKAGQEITRIRLANLNAPKYRQPVHQTTGHQGFGDIHPWHY